MKTIAIVPAAGRGRRLGLKISKPFVLLGGEPIIIRTLKALESSNHIDEIILAVERSRISAIKRLLKKHRIRKVTAVVKGGATRFESVRNCLTALDRSAGIVLIHDGARPLIGKALIKNSIRLARKYGGCVVAVPENDTVKLVDENLFVKKTLDRRSIFRAGTPQTFRRDLLERAYRLNLKRATDDASLVEMLGEKVKILEGSYKNIKITTKEDLKIAEALLKHR